MNKEKLNKLQEVINDQLDLIEMNVARINNKDYFGLDFELLKYIRNLENQLDTANKKIDKIEKYVSYKNSFEITNDIGISGIVSEINKDDILSIIGGNNE